MTDRPLPLTVLDREHWDLLTHRLVQPIAAYESFVTSGQNENPSIPWPPDLIAHYQVVTAPLRRRSWAVPAVLALAQLAVTAAMVAYGISVERRVARMIQEAGCEPAASQPPRDLIRRASR